MIGDTNDPSNRVVFNSDELIAEIETINLDAELYREEFTFRIVDKIINKYDKNNCIYILESKTGWFSALPEFKIDESTRKFDLSVAKSLVVNASYDTKEKLMYELNRKEPAYQMDMDSLEVKYSLFGRVKLAKDLFIKTINAK